MDSPAVFRIDIVHKSKIRKPTQDNIVYKNKFIVYKNKNPLYCILVHSLSGSAMLYYIRIRAHSATSRKIYHMLKNLLTTANRLPILFAELIDSPNTKG